MDKELNQNILKEKKLRCFLIAPYKFEQIDQSIIVDKETCEKFENITNNTMLFANKVIEDYKNKNICELSIYLIYFGHLVIFNGKTFEDYIKMNQDQIVGVYVPEDIYEEICLPFYEPGSFYFDFEAFLKILKLNNINLEINYENISKQFKVETKLSLKPHN